ncbi:TolC family protein [Flavobacterium gawalongense]|uniref:TolC family protein n=1 Tax=Flavobacterium gawalongense TaxID=2594432 RepID=A0A553BEG3_9FLAO|nr:TolC family protein [Flavobacterium gawalongense]TRW98961.1 TolC family protein [Flavobacterium gawalongense]TRX03529.1 TolC family protein [Flavobacterium gawalongense]TRX06640.1 TolC family protein [Flavobacterium gawalongense]TRX08532.1 TolC family protein [Flavobacterium gawalongense]TRX24860.1 TolC family protein [Flavobacterium gawalongense]
MLKNKYYIAISCLILSTTNLVAQTLSLEEVLTTIKTNNPQFKMYDADIQSMDAAAKGARSWMPPQVSTGFFMTPYNTKMWKADDMFPGMGNYMLGITQMIPNSKKLKADYNYMSAMSSVEKENKNYTSNQLNALAKTNYYQWLVLNKKIIIANDNLLLLDYMIKSIEIRYQYNMDKLPTYYKAKSQYSALQSMIVMLENDISQKRIMLNTLMVRDKNTSFEIDTTYKLNDFDLIKSDTTSLSQSRSDVKAIEKTIALNHLKIEAEKTKLLPEFGIKYDHMFAFGQQPQQFSLMGMVTIPMPWSSKMNKANINSFQIKNESLNWQKQMILNEASGMISGMNTELTNLKKQYDITEKSIIPALRRNYDTAIIAWQNNTGDLFVALDAWEALNMAQIDTLDKLQAILNAQVEIEKQLETK